MYSTLTSLELLKVEKRTGILISFPECADFRSIYSKINLCAEVFYSHALSHYMYSIQAAHKRVEFSGYN